MPLKRGFALVAFDELAWHEDLRQAAGSAKRIDLAFGVRHLPAGARGETVYQLAHRRLSR